ncbi:VCBS repeat-containing protein [Aliifodinibius sp. S!AR15-10]|uniref:VCBS repeat-containing protein n=1 Tax=Aliifodinibius sp. S!AR15-10 TaxID=2950437 RepID=UPI00285ED89A|nr:VCBS repeat-containing protein [Aliifodinibius sp. S!AR15-10]MDR8392898.1 VCBS repeat-containing protein [Aliifodinibius sp. S!AR15-10]
MDDSNIWAVLCLLVLALLLTSCSDGETLFEQLPADQTGINFSNRVTSSEDFNIINYTNIYNGGGVAIADFDQNGLQDLFFTGNQVRNELYLNQGDFTFTNVTEQANVAGEERWSSGVAAADVNGDGLMDLYVCATTYNEPERRANLLYINQGLNDQGVPVFKEMSRQYNLADTTNTTMAAFFDYDRDGDLDLYLLVNKFTRNSSMDRYHEKMTQGESVTTDRLYRNEGADSLGHPYFRDVSDQAGILMEGFGLGVNVSDLNKDGWPDIYVANDFVTNEVVYMNNGDGTFTDRAGELFKHTVHASMGSDVADINNDMHPDVMMVDMRPEDNYRKKTMLQPNDYSAYINNEKYDYDYQYVRNQLQVYQGDHPETGLPLYSDVGMFAGISETDWSWTPSVSDFDNDGLRDIIITNGFPKDITDHDFADYIEEVYNYLSLDKILQRIPSVKLSNYAFKNTGDLKFEDVTADWGMKIPSFSNGAAQVDLDNDGDLDYVVSNINDSAFVFRNRQSELNPETNNYLRVRFNGRGQNTMGLGAVLEISYGDGKRQYHEHTTYRGYLSSIEPIAHFGLGEADTVDQMTVTWRDGSVEQLQNIPANQVLTVDAANAANPENTELKQASKGESNPLMQEITTERGIDYVHREHDFNDFGVQPLLLHKLSQYGPGLSVGDVNGDGLDDLYISGAFEYKGTFMVQQQDGTFQNEDLLEGNNPKNREEEMGSLFFDADGDGDQDLYITSGGYEHEFGDQAYQDRLFINENGRFLLEEEALPNYFRASSSTVNAADFDRDGDLDLFVGGRVYPHQYPKPVDSYLLENVTEEGNVQFKNVNSEKAPALNSLGMISDALWTDFDNDGWTDLILAGEWMSLRFLKNESGKLTDFTPKTGVADKKGWWNSICGGDFDKDGDTDYVAGNLGTNTHFKASDQYPVRMYGNDFDKNGEYDAIPSVYTENREGKIVEVPYHVKQDVRKQIRPVHSMFDTYHSYGLATMDDMLAKFDTTGTLVEKANYMKTSYIENRGDGTFAVTPLEGKPQWAPVYGCIAEDINSDGNPDLVLAGNDYGTEIATGRYDALNGLVLIGQGDGSFITTNFEESGFFVPGDAKVLVKLRGADGSFLVVAGQNRGPLKMFSNQRNSEFLQVKPMDASAVITTSDGSSRKVEFYYGSSFLSSSSRFITLNEDIESVTVTNYQGSTRTIRFDE